MCFWFLPIWWVYVPVFLFNFFFNWRIIALQNFAVFCQTSTWISHGYTYIPSLLNLPPISLPILPLEVDTEPLSEFPEPYSKMPLAIYFTYGDVSSMLLFPYVSPSPPLSPCPQVYSLCLFFHCCPASKFFSTILLASVYIYDRIWYLSFSFWLTSLCIIGSNVNRLFKWHWGILRCFLSH